MDQQTHKTSFTIVVSPSLLNIRKNSSNPIYKISNLQIIREEIIEKLLLPTIIQL